MKVPCQDIVVDVEDIIYIELVYVKGNTKIVVHTIHDKHFCKISASLDAIEILFSSFGFVKSDSCNLVNLNKINYIEKTAYSIQVFFHGSSKTASCSRSGYAKVKSMLPLS
ncbi:LytTR family transcriptional regulator DNA-binding domain-containing protein [Paenibacillus agricola]|uniref:LytTR family transcriptional regulator n=1 Tax=Paenibacillus agricola TaxID=2716264 RepID=A0ABX0JF80_9BACL|nr:LytTR family transcriptional regulator DNA-binding domain-containing protein [Paenibacillus agricola]NHN32874.1 LytTR family transcriptional regulator [Paenibacillus agricola]